MIVAQCPNCSARYKVDQAMVDSHGGLFRCGKCRHKFNVKDDHKDGLEKERREPMLHPGSEADSAESVDSDANQSQDQVSSNDSSLSVSDTGLASSDTKPNEIDEPQFPSEQAKQGGDDNIVFNQYDSADEDLFEPKLDAERSASQSALQSSDSAPRSALSAEEADADEVHIEIGDSSDDDSTNGTSKAVNQNSDKSAFDELDEGSDLPNLTIDEHLEGDDGYEPDHSLSILDDVEEEQVQSGFGLVWGGMKSAIALLFWSIVVLLLLGLLALQFKSKLSPSLQEKLMNNPISNVVCNYVECQRAVRSSEELEVVVSRMDLDVSPTEPLNVSLFILNNAQTEQNYPIIKLSLKNSQAETVGQRFLRPEDYLSEPDREILPGSIGKVVLKLTNPPNGAVGYEVNLE